MVELPVERPPRSRSIGAGRLLASGQPARKVAAQLVALAVSRGALLGATLVVARVAGVGEFGHFALALVVFQAGLLLRDAGLGQAIVVMSGRDATLTWPAFLIVTTVGWVLAAIMAVAAEPVLAVLGLPAAAGELRLLAIAFGIGSIGVVSNATLEQTLRFEARAAIDVAAYCTLAVVAVLGALAGVGAGALALGYVAHATVQTGMSLTFVRPWSRLGSRRTGLGSFARYGGLLWASAFLSYVATNIDNAVVGRLGGAVALGTYALSYTIGNTITISMAQVLNRVALPYYARARHDGRSPSHALARVLQLSFNGTLIPAVAVIGFAPELRSALFPADASFMPLVLLSAYGVVRTLGMGIGTALNGVGLARVQLRASAVNVAVLLVGVVPAFAWAGTTGVAMIVLVATVSSVAFLAAPLYRTFGLTLALTIRPAALLALSVATTLALPGAVGLPIRAMVTIGIALVAATISLRVGLSRNSR